MGNYGLTPPFYESNHCSTAASTPHIGKQPEFLYSSAAVDANFSQGRVISSSSAQRTFGQPITYPIPEASTVPPALPSTVKSSFSGSFEHSEGHSGVREYLDGVSPSESPNSNQVSFSADIMKQVLIDHNQLSAKWSVH